MSDTRAYVKHVNAIGSGSTEDGMVHQSSPAWVLTFVRWENRDTQRITNVPSTLVRDPLVVENDCLSVAVSSTKSSLTPSMNATLIMSDVNYETAIAPGDFVLVNILNWETDARRVANSARSKKAINGPDDGFKGIFKVQGVRKTISVDPNTGTKVVLFRINGFAFTEYNNTIYFNPYLVDPNQDPKNQLLFASYLGKDWTKLVNQKGLTNVQDIIATLIQSFIGEGISDEGRLEKNGTVKSPNVHFYLPELVGKLLGVKGAKAAKDIYVHLFGLQKYSSGASQTLAAGMNPESGKLNQKFNRIYYTSTPCGGDSMLKPEYWNQVKAWSIINQYTNAPLNEIYTCFRISPNGSVMPTMVFRQIPFTNDDFKSSSLPVTKFTNLPRWKISPSLITDADLGRDESARINFVQYFGKSTITKSGAEIAQEIAKINYAYDINDVQRSGLRPYVVTSQFDEPTDKYKDFKSPDWAKILGDCLIGGHLKMNGSMTCIGIVDPIAVGDNLEFDGVIYHIEEVTHSANINIQNGAKIFRTTFSLSSGVSVTTSEKGTRYAEMDYQNAHSNRENDFARDKILPGVSEEQDTVYRTEKLNEPYSPNKGFPQPEQGRFGKGKK